MILEPVIAALGNMAAILDSVEPLICRLASLTWYSPPILGSLNPDNVASGRVLDRIGMRKEGVLRHHRAKGGVWRDSVICSILEDEHNL